MRTSSTLEMAGHQGHAGAAPGVACRVTAAMNLTTVWSIVGDAIKPASPVFHTDRPDRRHWELSP